MVLKSKNILFMVILLVAIILLSNKHHTGNIYKVEALNINNLDKVVSDKSFNSFDINENPLLIDMVFDKETVWQYWTLILAGGIIGQINGNTNWVAVADFNNDGWKDVFDAILSASFFSTGTFDVLLRNNGVGNLVVENLLSLPIDQSMIADADDVNNDGYQDVVVGNNFESFFNFCGQPDLLYLNNGTGGFYVGFNFGDNELGSDIEIGDINNDGWKDVVTGNVPSPAGCGTGTSKVYINNGPYVISAVPIGGTGSIINYAITFADNTAVSLPSPVPASDTALEDFDNDGDLDLVTVMYSNLGTCNFKIFKNNGAGIFIQQNVPTTSSVFSHYCFKMEAVDLDNDSDKDLVITNPTTNSSTNGITFMQNNGNAVFSTPIVIVDGISYTNGVVYPGAVAYDIETGDFNNDGKQDIFVALPIFNPFMGSTKIVLLNNNNFNFNKLQNVGSMWTGLSIITNGTIVKLFDANNDNKLDVLLNRRGPAHSNNGQASALFYHV